MTRKYLSDNGFRAALNHRIQARARAVTRTPAELRREFFMQRMLARVFADPSAPWILKGGAGLLVRLPGARSSEDVDLLHPRVDLALAFEELRAVVSVASSLDRITFRLEVGQRRAREGSSEVWKLRATPYLGAAPLQHFPIDLTAGTVPVGVIDRIEPVPVIEIPDVVAPPPFACYPLADQIADKLAAMYEYHGIRREPSTRWRDLVDLVLLIRRFPFDAATTRAVLAQQPARRPDLDLPDAVRPPAPAWEQGYRNLARRTMLPPELHTLTAALEHLGRCLNPLLDGSVTTGTWNPERGAWEPADPALTAAATAPPR
ncbi:nucleotidyl transferase AbiEii/AbiGii toxin family protein [Nocardia sp. NPDC057353]|uniref:nucleotidyl transferase AbiEii/AbiGii toxin family protein n=1 Tax=Nocardia sp. NPDC057353 TaxID=3346104 RepID=UPI00363F7F74